MILFPRLQLSLREKRALTSRYSAEHHGFQWEHHSCLIESNFHVVTRSVSVHKLESNWALWVESDAANETESFRSVPGVYPIDDRPREKGDKCHCLCYDNQAEFAIRSFVTQWPTVIFYLRTIMLRRSGSTHGTPIWQMDGIVSERPRSRYSKPSGRNSLPTTKLSWPETICDVELTTVKISFWHKNGLAFSLL